MVDDYLKVNRNQLLKDTFLHIVQTMPLETLDEAGTILEENNVLQSYGGIQIPLDFWRCRNTQISPSKRPRSCFHGNARLWKSFVKNFFPHSIVLAPDTQKHAACFLLGHSPCAVGRKPWHLCHAPYKCKRQRNTGKACRACHRPLCRRRRFNCSASQTAFSIARLLLFDRR